MVKVLDSFSQSREGLKVMNCSVENAHFFSFFAFHLSFHVLRRLYGSLTGKITCNCIIIYSFTPLAKPFLNLIICQGSRISFRIRELILLLDS